MDIGSLISITITTATISTVDTIVIIIIMIISVIIIIIVFLLELLLMQPAGSFSESPAGNVKGNPRIFFLSYVKPTTPNI